MLAIRLIISSSSLSLGMVLVITVVVSELLEVVVAGGGW